MKGLWRTLITAMFPLGCLSLAWLAFVCTSELLKWALSSGRFPRLAPLLWSLGPWITTTLLLLPSAAIFVAAFLIGKPYFDGIRDEEELESAKPSSTALVEQPLCQKTRSTEHKSSEVMILGYQSESLNQLSSVLSGKTPFEKDQARFHFHAHRRSMDYLWAPDRSYFLFQAICIAYFLIIPVGVSFIILLADAYLGDIWTVMLLSVYVATHIIGGISWLKRRSVRSADSLGVAGEPDEEFLRLNTSEVPPDVALAVRRALANMYCMHPNQIRHDMGAREFCCLMRGRPLLAEFAVHLEQEPKTPIDSISFIHYMRGRRREDIKSLLKDVQLFIGKATVDKDA